MPENSTTSVSSIENKSNKKLSNHKRVSIRTLSPQLSAGRQHLRYYPNIGAQKLHLRYDHVPSDELWMNDDPSDWLNLPPKAKLYPFSCRDESGNPYKRQRPLSESDQLMRSQSELQATKKQLKDSKQQLRKFSKRLERADAVNADLTNDLFHAQKSVDSLTHKVDRYEGEWSALRDINTLEDIHSLQKSLQETLRRVETRKIEIIQSLTVHNSLATNSESALCVVCLVEMKDTVFLPCKHLCACHSCARNIIFSPLTPYTQRGRCCVCQQQVAECLKIFSS